MAEQESIELPKSQEELRQMLDQARLEGAKITARTVAHFWGNKGGHARSVLDLITNSLSLPDDFKPPIEDAFTGLDEFDNVIDKLNNLKRVEPTFDQGGNLPTVDLEKSTRKTSPETEPEK